VLTSLMAGVEGASLKWVPESLVARDMMEAVSGLGALGWREIPLKYDVRRFGWSWGLVCPLVCREVVPLGLYWAFAAARDHSLLPTRTESGRRIGTRVPVSGSSFGLGEGRDVIAVRGTSLMGEMTCRCGDCSFGFSCEPWFVNDVGRGGRVRPPKMEPARFNSDGGTFSLAVAAAAKGLSPVTEPSTRSGSNDSCCISLDTIVSTYCVSALFSSCNVLTCVSSFRTCSFAVDISDPP